MAQFNKVVLLGNLGRDLALRFTRTGRAVVNFDLAVNEKFIKDGEQVSKTEWLPCVAWGRMAENLVKYTRKGSQILVEGRLTMAVRKERIEGTDDFEEFESMVVVVFSAQFLTYIEGADTSSKGEENENAEVESEDEVNRAMNEALNS